MDSLQTGDLDSSQMKIVLDFLTSQECCDEQKTFDSILNLSEHIKTGNEKPFRYALTIFFFFVFMFRHCAIKSRFALLNWRYFIKNCN